MSRHHKDSGIGNRALVSILAGVLMAAALPSGARDLLHLRDINSAVKKMADARQVAEKVKREGERAERTAKNSSEQKAAEEKIVAANAELRVLAATENYINGGATPPENLEEVEEVIVRLARNVWVTCQGSPWMSAESNENFGPILASHIEKIRGLTRAVGRIAKYDVDAAGAIKRVHAYLGTAVAVGKRQIITNKHVILESGLGYEDAADNSKLKLVSSAAAGIEFPVEYDRCNPPPVAIKNRVKILNIDYADPKLDFVVVSVDGDLDNFVSFPSTADLASGDRVAVIGYPARPGDVGGFLSPIKIDQIFRTPDGRTPFLVQRLAEGFSLPKADDVPAGYFRYDATTWGGNSGSLVMSLATGEILGLHSRGLQSQADGAGYNEAIDTACISAAISPGTVTAATDASL